MKLLHTSDWHLGKRLDTFSRFEEQEAVLKEITAIANNENVDAVLIAGDLFDTFNPPVEAVELFYRTLKNLSRGGACPVVAIAGNHDSPERIEAPDPLARELAIILAGYPITEIRPFKNDAGVELLQSKAGFIELKTPKYNYPLRIILNPYANQFRLRKYLNIEDEENEMRDILQNNWQNIANKHCDNKGVNILLSHMFFVQKGAQMPEETDDEKPILHIGGVQALYPENIPPQIQYAAIGHLHRKQVVSKEPCPVVYSGSPISYSFSEANQQKYVQIINIEPDKEAEIYSVELKSGRKLLRKSFDDIDKAVEWLAGNQENLIELTIESENYLTAEERKQLKNAHPYIINIIPKVKSAANIQEEMNNIDISKNIEELFTDYFRHKKGQMPNKVLIDLFKEIHGK
ncbi:MAG: exonuclease subunit SbcD [Bacteroidales bacterium]|nr:exonuclease subunit SbcD [Bacteroidales bacterium]